MTTKTEFVTQLKAINPTLQTGNDDEGYTDLTSTEYNAKISEWADALVAKEAKLAAEAAAETAKAAILAKLGITVEQLRIVLG